MKMNDLQRTTLIAACTLFGALILLFICIFRVSNATALVIIVNTAILGFVSLVTSSRLRYLVLACSSGRSLWSCSSTSRPARCRTSRSW